MKKILLAGLMLLLMASLAFSDAYQYTGLSVFNFATDSSGYPPDSVWMAGWTYVGAGPDTGKYFNKDSVQIRWPAHWRNSAGTTQVDSTSALVKLFVASLNDTIQPVAALFWRDNNGFVTKEPVLFGPPQIVHLVDTILAGGGGSSTGTGPYAASVYVLNGAVPIATATVRAQPNGGGPFLQGETDANGLVVFSTLADTLLLYAYATGYSQDVVPDTIRVPGVDATDTLQMDAVTTGAPPSPNLTQILFYFYDGTGGIIKNVEMAYTLKTTATYVYHLDSTKIIDPSEVHHMWSDATGLVTVNVIPNDSLLVKGGRTGETRWNFKATSPLENKNLLGDDGIDLNVPASDTSLVYPRDRAAFDE